MYSGAPSDGLSGLLGVLMAGSVIYILIWLAVVFISGYIAYRIIRAGVRDGVVEALKRTGTSGIGGGLIQGYPPAQSYGAPVAPHAEQPYQGYGG